MIITILCAAFGGLLINLLNLLELHNIPKERRPDFKDILYWLPFLAWPIIGAILAFAYKSSGENLNPILSINVGLSAPLILRSVASVIPIQSKK